LRSGLLVCCEVCSHGLTEPCGDLRLTFEHVDEFASPDDVDDHVGSRHHGRHPPTIVEERDLAVALAGGGTGYDDTIDEHIHASIENDEEFVPGGSLPDELASLFAGPPRISKPR